MADTPAHTLSDDETPKDLTGAKIGRYLVEREIGRGGMGEVYLARDTLLERTVALKRVARKFSNDATHRRLLLHEAQRASRVTDPRIAAVHDVLEENGELIIVMEFVEGMDLRKRMSSPIEIEEFWDLAEECTKAIEVAHRRGLIHRDIKPENIMLSSEGQVKILDLGLAHRKAAQGDLDTLSTKVMQGGSASGTPMYASPEVHLGEEPDERCDIFSLGVVFYEVLAGRLPFEGQTLGALANQIINVDPEPICCAKQDTPPALSWIVTKMLSKDPGQRYTSARELLDDLVAARRGELAVKAPPVGRSKRSLPGRALILTSVLIVFVVVVLLGPTEGARRLAAWAGLYGLPSQKHVAVLPLEVKGGNEHLSSFALGLTEILTSALAELSADPGLQVQSRMKEVLDRNVTSPRSARELLGANLALATTLEEDHQNLIARIRLVDARKDRVLGQRKVHSTILEPTSFMKSVFQAFAELLKIGTEGRDDVRSLELGAAGAGTVRFLLSGMGKLRGPRSDVEIEEAIRELRLACDTDPSNAVARACLARALLHEYNTTGDSLALAAAAKEAREAVDLGIQRPEGPEIMARILMERHQWDEAIDYLEKAVALDPLDDDATYELARLCGRRGNPEREEEIFKRAMEARPHYWRPYWWLGGFYYRQGRFPESRRSYEQMIQRAPDFYSGYSNLGGILVLNGDYEQAVETLSKSIELRPTDIALSNLATAYFNMRRFDQAIHTYNQAFQAGFQNYEIWNNLGDAYFWASKERHQAMGAYRHGIQLGWKRLDERPTDLLTLANLAQVYPKLGEPDSARTCIEEALRRAPGNPNIQYYAALTYWQIGEKDLAMDWLERAVAGGYPARWLRDSAVFDDWRREERFRALVEPVEGKAT